ncbi:hypothetical protein [Pelagibacterium lacus]|uniref:Serine protease n=1 Tax=Pelagibacterium lacus TaxID=2282655 RepID=A0A369W0P2_9HYPH|nr:hypothetical protein [Pelagibacterium lacus]RDE07943.1 hypothetical protein DVH29_14155 [Pelagibacterium lacus]
MKRLLLKLVLGTFLPVVLPGFSNASMFDDGNDRQSILELRHKEESLLTQEEHAILWAANLYGSIRFCNGDQGGNAALIRFNGLPAVITAGHMLVDNTGELLCDKTSAADAFYMPNVGYYDPHAPQADDDFVLRRVRLQYPPVNLKEYIAAVETGNRGGMTAADWLVFFLDEHITTDVMPDGHERGFLEYSSNRESFDTGQLYLIGMHRDLDEGLVAHYQRCDYANLANLSVQHVCDTLPGTSGSILLSMEDGELRFRAIHSSGRFNGPEGAADRHIFDHVPQDRSKWNSATPALRVFEAQDPEFQRLP